MGDVKHYYSFIESTTNILFIRTYRKGVDKLFFYAL